MKLRPTYCDTLSTEMREFIEIFVYILYTPINMIEYNISNAVFWVVKSIRDPHKCFAADRLALPSVPKEMRLDSHSV